jgi:hypothetical protein
MSENKKTIKEKVERFTDKLSGRQIVSIVVFLGAIAVMISGKDGWGWLLFLAFLIHQD